MNWKAYFFFTQGERRGVIALLIVASLFLLIRVLLANKLEDSSVIYAEESSISSINISEIVLLVFVKMPKAKVLSEAVKLQEGRKRPMKSWKLTLPTLPLSKN